MSNYYETLGIDKGASQGDIKKAYRTLSKKHHPDHNLNDKGSEDRFKEINEAYSVLSNDEKRHKYDNPNPFKGMFGAGGFNPFGGMRQRPQKPDFNAPKDGSFLGIEIIIPLKIFIFGGKHIINISYQESCADCSGNGFIVGKDSNKCSVCNGEGYVQHVQRRAGFQSMHTGPCDKCHGTGLNSIEKCLTCGGSGNARIQDKEFSFDVEAGSGIGTRIILKGDGCTGVNGGRNGDIGIMVVGIESLDVSKLTDEQVEQLENILEGQCEN